MKSRAFPILIQIHGLLIALYIPYFLAFFIGIFASRLDLLIYSVEIIMISLFILRKEWKIFLKNCVPNLKPYAIKFMLLGFIFMLLAVIDDIIRNTPGEYGFIELTFLCIGMFLVSMSFLGSTGEALTCSS